MNKKSYLQPEMRVVELRHQVALLGQSNRQSTKNVYSSEEDIDFYTDGLDDDYSDN